MHKLLEITLTSRHGNTLNLFKFLFSDLNKLRNIIKIGWQNLR